MGTSDVTLQSTVGGKSVELGTGVLIAPLAAVCAAEILPDASKWPTLQVVSEDGSPHVVEVKSLHTYLAEKPGVVVLELAEEVTVDGDKKDVFASAANLSEALDIAEDVLARKAKVRHQRKVSAPQRVAGSWLCTIFHIGCP